MGRRMRTARHTPLRCSPPSRRRLGPDAIRRAARSDQQTHGAGVDRSTTLGRLGLLRLRNLRRRARLLAGGQRTQTEGVGGLDHRRAQRRRSGNPARRGRRSLPPPRRAGQPADLQRRPHRRGPGRRCRRLHTYQRGHRVLRIVRKGGKAATAPLNPITVRALDAYMADDHPTSGPLFLDRTKSKRLAYTTAYEMIQRLARNAGIPAAESITPHSFRHTFITEALSAGIPLQDVQDAAGHTDPRTTRRYDHGRHNLDRHPTYVLAGHLRPESVSWMAVE